MLKDFFEAFSGFSKETLAHIENVQYRNGIDNTIEFEFYGDKYRGFLKNRNEDLIIGFNEEYDRGIALRVLLDGDAEMVDNEI